MIYMSFSMDLISSPSAILCQSFFLLEIVMDFFNALFLLSDTEKVLVIVDFPIWYEKEGLPLESKV